MSVAVIGAGGIGSIMIQGLARLGFHQIVVIDPDSAEVSNLNRVAAMTYADAVSGALKVDIACKSIEAIHPKVRASPICRSVFDPELVPILKGCDMIVVATDGRPINIRVVNSLGMGLDEKAIETVRTWRFEPGQKDGHPVNVEMAVEVDFHLY